MMLNAQQQILSAHFATKRLMLALTSAIDLFGVVANVLHAHYGRALALAACFALFVP